MGTTDEVPGELIAPRCRTAHERTACYQLPRWANGVDLLALFEHYLQGQLRMSCLTIGRIFWGTRPSAETPRQEDYVARESRRLSL